MTDRLDDRNYELLFGIRRSVRYHNHRRRFYELWNTATVTVAALGGSSAVASFVAGLPPSWAWLPAALAGSVAVLGAVDLSVGTARRANQHAELAREFIGLEKSYAHGRDLDDDEFATVTRQRLEIEAREPPPLRLLDAMCHYELLTALGDDVAGHPRIPWFRRLLANWISQTGYARRLAGT